MGFWVVLFGFAVGIFSVVTIGMIASGATDAIAGGIILVIISLILFLLCLKKYRSPEHQKKMKEAQEKWAAYRERKRQGQEAETIVATRLIGKFSAGCKKNFGSVLFRGAVGGFFAGSAGATLGMATAMNKKVCRFLVKYSDGHSEEKEATVGSAEYKEYMKYLEWEE